jgi:hypothetical protein
MSSLVDDMTVLNRDVFFHNWQQEPFRSMMRYKKHLLNLFTNGKLNEVIKRLHMKHIDDAVPHPELSAAPA